MARLTSSLLAPKSSCLSLEGSRSRPADTENRSIITIIIDNPERVARELKTGLQLVRDFRKEKHDAYNFNWSLKIDGEFQHRFRPTHEAMRNLDLHQDQPTHRLAANLRRAFSGLVAGNVKADGIREIEKHGKFEIHGDPAILTPMDALLTAFAQQGRMKLSGKQYVPCYRIVA